MLFAANYKRPNEVFGDIYYLLITNYKIEISEGYLILRINGEVPPDQAKPVDSITLSLLADVFK
jgi:hypothetical protein